MGKLLKVIFSGTAIGIALLMLGYVGIYYVSGEDIFIQEITQLGKINTLQSQLIITGVSGMLIALSIYYIERVMAQENTATYKIVLGGVFLTISAIFAMMLNEKMNENIADMMVVISATLVCIYAFANSIRTVLYDINLRRNKNINESKEKNPEETEKGN